MKKIATGLFLIIITASIGFSQILLDNFTRIDNTTVGNGWSETESAASGAQIISNQLVLSNAVVGREWVYQDVASHFETIYDNNTSDLAWLFNMKTSTLTPTGFNSGRYAAMFVLGASTSDYTTASGYGIAIGKSGGNYPLTLVRFTGGFDYDNKIIELISAGDYGADYLDIRVNLNPGSATWTLYVESDPLAFGNPTGVTTQAGTPYVDNTHTALDLVYFGAYYNHGASAVSQTIFDNIFRPGGGGTSTYVNFVSTVSTAGEASGTATINVSISNPDATNATYVDVVRTNGTATNGTDIATFTSQTLTFPAGSGAIQSATVTINEDTEIEASETVEFELQNVLGGNSAVIAVPSGHTLTIADNEIYELMISEVTDPSDAASTVRYVELYNAEGSSLDFSSQTWYLCRQENGHPNKWDDILLSGSVVSGEIYVVADNLTNFNTVYSTSADLGNANIDGDGNDTYALYFGGDHTSGTLVDIYGVINQNGLGYGWEYTDGHGERNPGVNAPNPSWTNAEWTIATPVFAADLNPTDTSLPIELKSFRAVAHNNSVSLHWTTASEINNMGFIIERAETKEGPFMELDSYIHNSDLRGAGESSNDLDYVYADYTAFNGITYWYKLVDVDFNGIQKEHGLVAATPTAKGDVTINNHNLPESFRLGQNFPNPFNPSTSIQFDIPVVNTDMIEVVLNVFNVVGQKVTTLYSAPLVPGHYAMQWDGLNDLGTQMPTGVYFYEFRSSQFVSIKKMMLIR